MEQDRSQQWTSGPRQCFAKVLTEARCPVRVARGKSDVEPAVGAPHRCGGPSAKNAVAAVASRRVVAVHGLFETIDRGEGSFPLVSKWVDETNTKETSWIRTELDQVHQEAFIGACQDAAN